MSAASSSRGSAARHRRDRALRIALGLAVAALERADRRPHASARRPRASRASRTARAPGRAARRSRRRGTRASPAARAAARRPPTFQNAVAPATRPASSALTAWKPIVIGRTLSGSPPSPATTEREHRVVGRQAGDAGALALEVLRRADLRLGEHGRERPLHERHHADDVVPLLAGEPEVVDVEDRHVGAPGFEQLERVGRRAGRAHRQLDALGLVVLRAPSAR